MNQRKVGAILSYVGFFISNIVGIIYSPIMLRLMGQSEYGLYGTASSLTSYLSLLSFGIGGAYLRYNAQCRAANDLEGEHRLNGAFFLVFTVLSGLVLVFGGAMVAFAKLLVEETFTDTEIARMQIIMIFGVISTVLVFLFNVVMMAIQAYEKYIFLRIASLIAGIATPILNVVALYMGGRAVALSAISLVISIVCYISYVIYALKVLHFRMSFKGIKLAWFKELFIFSSFLFLNMLTDQVTNATDSIILGAVSGTAAVAIYTVGANFKTYFLNFSTSISSVFSARVNEIVVRCNDNTALDELFIRVGRIQFFVLSLILIGYISIGHDFVRLWAGPNYTDSYLIGLYLLLAVYIPLFQNVGLEIQKAKNKHKARSIVYLLISFGNVAMTIPFAQLWEGAGAAFATLFCMFLGNVLFMNYYYWKHIGLDIPGFWKSILSILPGFILPSLCGFLINRFFTLTSYMEILVAALVISAVYLISVWLFSMNTYEQNLLKAPIQKLFKRFIRSEKS